MHFKKSPLKYTLANVNDTCYPEIVINEWDIMKSIGRNEESKIIDVHLSRQQLVVKPNFNDKKFLAMSVGTSLSSIDGNEMQRDVWYEVQHGNIIQLIPNNFMYRVLYKENNEWAQLKYGNGKVEKLFNTKVLIGRYPIQEATEQNNTQLVVLTQNEIHPKILAYTSKHHITIEKCNDGVTFKTIAATTLIVNHIEVKQGETIFLQNNSSICLSSDKMKLFEISYVVDEDVNEWED
ncbi:hypothetical protein ACKWTF_005111 [Chironomus riparius]